MYICLFYGIKLVPDGEPSAPPMDTRGRGREALQVRCRWGIRNLRHVKESSIEKGSNWAVMYLSYAVFF